ncbi:MAG: hypothetical protein ACRC80_26005 [Waterburya sp.]
MELITTVSKSGKTKYFGVKLENGFIVEMRSKKAALAFMQEIDSKIKEYKDECNFKQSRGIQIQQPPKSYDILPNSGDGGSSSNNRTTPNLSSLNVPQATRDTLQPQLNQKQRTFSSIVASRQKGEISNSQLPECIQRLFEDSKRTIEDIANQSRDIANQSRDIARTSRDIARIAEVAIGVAASVTGVDVGVSHDRTERTIHAANGNLEQTTIDVKHEQVKDS